MKPHPRIRKTIKWGGAAVTVLLVVVWIGSGWERWDWRAGHIEFAIDRGQFNVSSDMFQFAKLLRESFGSVVDVNWKRFLWHFQWERDRQEWHLAVPLWSIVLGSAAPSLLAWLSDIGAHRRARLNLCPKCNYDRAGIAAGAVCPECGSAAP